GNGRAARIRHATTVVCVRQVARKGNNRPMPRFTHALCGASLIVLMSLAAGCSTQVSIHAWQQSVNHYVQTKGGGDPTILRDMKLPVDGRPGYAVIGHHDVEESTDAKALLLGNEQLGGRVRVR